MSIFQGKFLIPKNTATGAAEAKNAVVQTSNVHTKFAGKKFSSAKIGAKKWVCSCTPGSAAPDMSTITREFLAFKVMGYPLWLEFYSTINII